MARANLVLKSRRESEDVVIPDIFHIVGDFITCGLIPDALMTLTDSLYDVVVSISDDFSAPLPPKAQTMVILLETRECAPELLMDMEDSYKFSHVLRTMDTVGKAFSKSRLMQLLMECMSMESFTLKLSIGYNNKEPAESLIQRLFFPMMYILYFVL